MYLTSLCKSLKGITKIALVLRAMRRGGCHQSFNIIYCSVFIRHDNIWNETISLYPIWNLWELKKYIEKNSNSKSIIDTFVTNDWKNNDDDDDGKMKRMIEIVAAGMDIKWLDCKAQMNDCRNECVQWQEKNTNGWKTCTA